MKSVLKYFYKCFGFSCFLFLPLFLNTSPKINCFFFSVVEFERAEDAERAIKEIEGTVHEGRTIHVRQVSIEIFAFCKIKIQFK